MWYLKYLKLFIERASCELLEMLISKLSLLGNERMPFISAKSNA